jgi:hypothetical protein
MMPPYQEFKGRIVMGNQKAFKQLSIRRSAFHAGREELSQVLQSLLHLANCHDRGLATVISSYLVVRLKGSAHFFFGLFSEDALAFAFGVSILDPCQSPELTEQFQGLATAPAGEQSTVAADE